jgi:hypothetical protein
MTAIAVTAANVSPAYPQESEILTVKLAEAVTAGQTAYQLTAGTFGLADANASGKQQFRGIFLQAGAAGDYVAMLKRGYLYGFTVSGLNADAVLYLSDTAGALDDAAGTMTVVCGRVFMLPDATPTRIVYIDAQWAQIWS